MNSESLTWSQSYGLKQIKTPLISVIIIGYNRNDYLEEALESAYNQTLEHSLYEIIVITNFMDKGLEKKYDHKNVKFVILPDGPVSYYISRGVEISSGKIVSFLDDDDVFLPNKLENVLTAFLKYDNLVYFHNNFVYFQIPKRTIKKMKRDIIIETGDNVRNWPQSGHIYKIINNSFAINLSSVSVKRDVLLTNLDKLNGMFGATDYYILFIYLSVNNSRLLFSKNELSMYRINNSMSHTSSEKTISIEQFSKLCSNQLRSFKSLLAFNATAYYSNIILAFISQWELLSTFIGVLGEYKKILRETINFLRMNYRFRYKIMLPILTFTISGLLWHKEAVKLFLKIRSVVYF